MDEQLRRLRSQGTVLKPSIIIGKNGLTDHVIENVKKELKKNAIVKVRILPSYIEEYGKAILKEIAEKTNTILVQSIGFTVVLGRKTSKGKGL